MAFSFVCLPVCVLLQTKNANNKFESTFKVYRRFYFLFFVKCASICGVSAFFPPLKPDNLDKLEKYLKVFLLSIAFQHCGKKTFYLIVTDVPERSLSLLPLVHTCENPPFQNSCHLSFYWQFNNHNKKTENVVSNRNPRVDLWNETHFKRLIDWKLSSPFISNKKSKRFHHVGLSVLDQTFFSSDLKLNKYIRKGKQKHI